MRYLSVTETANHFRCIDMMIDNAKATLTEKFIKELHLLLKNGTSASRNNWFAVGDYKKMPNEVGGMDTALPEEVAGKMKALLTEYNTQKEKAFEDILDFHVRFERIHPFQDGNTRGTAVFMIKYMKTFGFKVNNDAFEKNSRYFRNALVRANYNDLQNSIHATAKFLEMLFGNLILGTDYELKNRYLHVDYVPKQNDSAIQSAMDNILKGKICTLNCPLDELVVWIKK